MHIRSPGVTVTVNCCDVDRNPPPSTSVTLHVLTPYAFGAGVKVSMPAFVSCGDAVNIVNVAALLLLQLTVKANAESVSPGPAEIALAHCVVNVLVSSFTVMLLTPGVKLGGSFTAATAAATRACVTGCS
jgi:hypothetical protein